MIYAKAAASGQWETFPLPGGPDCQLRVTGETAYLRLPVERDYPSIGSIHEFYPLTSSLQFDDRLRIFRQRLRKDWGYLAALRDDLPYQGEYREDLVEGEPDEVATFVRMELERLHNACDLRQRARHSEGCMYRQVALLLGPPT